MSVVPKKSLGQHFLVDENILGVIGRLADLRADDVVFEVGPGLGVLTRYLAERARFVHAVELDRALEEPLKTALAHVTNVELRFGDALRLDLGDLDPQPTKLVANLPYSVATPLVVETLAHASLELWCVMVQREVADRLFAPSRTKAYGAVSVLVQLVCKRVGLHPVARTVFRPRPRVDSAIVAFERYGDLPSEKTRELAAAAFAHRRKTLANSAAHAGFATREEVETALDAIDRPPNVRAEELEPVEFVALADALR